MTISFSRGLLAIALLGAGRTARAQQLVPGDTLHLRLLDRVGSHHHTHSRVRALVIAPVTRDSARTVVPPGSVLTGRVLGAGVESFGGKRHWVDVRFDSIAIPMSDSGTDSLRAAITVRMLGIDDSREMVDTAGRIVGAPIPSIVKSKRDWAVMLLGFFHPVGAIVLAATLEGERAERHRAIVLNVGYELSAVVTSGATLAEWPRWSPPPPIARAINADSIARALPMHASLPGGHVPSDVISIAMIGSASQLSAAFAHAGWTRAVPLSFRDDFVVFEKAAKGQGFESQPVSELVLNGRAPTVVYEKVADTFVKRHHFRVWRWPAGAVDADTSALWLIAATHDTGLMFSTKRRSFTHIVDPRIDEERDKIVSDLVAAGTVSAMSYVPRVAPASGTTVNGGKKPAVTDWRLAVLELR